MKKLMLGLASFFIVAGCGDAIEGILTLNANVALKIEGRGVETVAKGQYQVKVSENENDNYLNLEFQELFGEKDLDAHFHYQDGMKFPKENGTFDIDSGVTQQNIGLSGNVQTTYERGDLRRDYEHCREQVRRTICYVDGQGNRRCEDHWEWENGRRDVEFRLVTKTRTIDVELISYGGDSLGAFNAEEVSTYRDYTYQGFCDTW